jgi:ABC-2 type transport system ATP-binding protein
VNEHPALEAHGVGKRYSSDRPLALADVELEISHGTITALVGPNGAGKSTLIKAWAGFERPTAGRVAVAGLDPYTDRAGVLARLGYVPQSAALYRDLTVTDHLDLAGHLRPGFDRNVAVRRLIDLAIPTDVRCSQLSGGQRAQVNLALVLGSGADILLLDEPLASLDPLARREFLYILTTTVRERGTTALMSSHVVTDVEQACDRLVVLGDGHKFLDARVSVALASHRIALGEVSTISRARPIASFLGLAGEILTLVDVADGEDPVDVLREASLEELVLGYLAAGRPGMLDRVRAGVAGR